MTIKMKEDKILQLYASDDHTWSILELEGYVDIDSIVITDKKGNIVKPSSYNLFGYPEFTYEFFNHYLNEKSLVFSLEYEIKKIDTEVTKFSSIEGLEEFLNTFEDLRKVVVKRKLYCNTYNNIRLASFVVLGKYILDGVGNIQVIIEKRQVKGNIDKVMYKSKFDKICTNYAVASFKTIDSFDEFLTNLML